MARGINKVILIGNLGADPETRAMPSGTTVANLRVATSESWRDKQSGEQQERTEWHRVALFGRLAEIAAEYLKKGSQVYIEGSLRTRKWQDKQGNERYSTEIIGNELQMLGGRGGGGGGGRRQGERGGAAPAYAEESGGGGGGGAGSPAPSRGEEFDDDSARSLSDPQSPSWQRRSAPLRSGQARAPHRATSCAALKVSPAAATFSSR